MAKAASECLGERIEAGVVVTKHDHVMGPVANFACFEAGHPVPDENSFRGTQATLDLVSNLLEKATVLFLLSGSSLCTGKRNRRAGFINVRTYTRAWGNCFRMRFSHASVRHTHGRDKYPAASASTLFGSGVPSR